MGAEQLNSDKNIQLLVQLQRRVYYAGQEVQGVVHMQVLAQSYYRNLDLIFMTKEYVSWQKRQQYRSYHDNRTHYHSETQYQDTTSYYVEFNLASFNGPIQPGQYSFPFSFILPFNLPSTIRLDSTNYITNLVCGVLPKYDNQSKNQEFRRTIHVREPPKGPKQTLRGDIFQPSSMCCCCCCCNCGGTRMGFQTNVDHIRGGSTFHLRGFIKSELNLKGFKIVLKPTTKRTTYNRNDSIDQSSISHQNQIILYDDQRSIPSGQEQKIDLDVTLPDNCEEYTALGHNLARFHRLAFVAKASFCIANPKIQVLTYVTSKMEPRLAEDEKVRMPQNWRPNIAQPRNFRQLAPYGAPLCIIMAEEQRKDEQARQQR